MKGRSLTRPEQSSPGSLVSVGLPVYNGERFLAVAIESILHQSLSDLELVISDNASTDATERIAREYVLKDSRVRYLRQPHNVGINRNYNFVVQHARGKFFKWLSASDYCAPSLLQSCCDVLCRNREAVLCFGGTRFVDDQARELEVFGGDFGVASSDPVERFLEVTLKLSLNSPLNAGVIRTAALRRAGPIGNYPSADVVLVAALALQGCFVLLPEVTFFRRRGAAYSTPDRTPMEIERLHNPNANSVSVFRAARRHWGRAEAVMAAPLSMRDKVRALIAAMRVLYWDRRELSEEVVAALRQLNHIR